MSMLGVRDLSVIETPPENRFPIQTYVMEYNGGIVREAIERELARDGQVYFLYNRVEDIERKAEEISMLVPDAKVTYAHGKMTENELESVMLSFLAGESDVLVSTTIIETGVDIPNVNTLIVHDADKMGLSQLYQLRGRVGRSNRVAYAYFTYRNGYARQDRKARAREPITAKLAANLLETAGATRVITLDLHAPQIQGFFDIPIDHLMGVPILSEYFKKKAMDGDVVIVSPDHGGVTRARKMRDILNIVRWTEWEKH